MTLPNKPTTEFQTEFSEEVWDTTYKYHKDETVDDTLYRTAKGIAQAEKTPELQNYWTDIFYEMLSGFAVTTGGRIYSNAGTDYAGTTLFNCYTTPYPTHDIDSVAGIIQLLNIQAQTLKSEGGWGCNFSHIRPRGAKIEGIGAESPGVVKFMELFDASSDIITSGSGIESKDKTVKKKIRKGAMMGICDASHPSIFEFITAKQTAGRLTKFNLSVNCTDAFMEKVQKVTELRKKGIRKGTEYEAADKWDLIFPDTKHPEYKTHWNGDVEQWQADGRPVKVYETVSAFELWEVIMKSTHQRNEPGVLFLGAANRYASSTYHPSEKIRATNPCGEQIMPSGLYFDEEAGEMKESAGICCLSSINMTQFVNEDRSGFDLERLADATTSLVRFLDNVNEVAQTPLKQYDYARDHKRRIGIGIMGWGSALYMLKVKFGSDRAEEIKKEFMGLVARTAYMASIDLAIERGMYTYCDPVKHAETDFIKRLDLPEEYMEKLRTTGIRNSSLLSIQPNGNTSIFANMASGGLEPVFMPEYIRTSIVSSMPDEIKDVCPKWYEGEFFETEMFKFAKEGDETILRGVGPSGTVYKIDSNRGLVKETLCEDYGVRFMKSIGEWDASADWACSTTDLSVEEHLTDMKGFAYWIDSSMSKTVNLPEDYPFDDFKDMYLDGYNSGVLKGLTSYRAGSMTSVLSAADEADATDDQEEIILENVKLPEIAPAEIKTLRAEGKKYYVTTSFFEDSKRPFAMFVKSNYKESSAVADEAVELLLDLAQTKGIPPTLINDQIFKMQNDNNANKVARAISLCLRHGVFIRNIVATLDKSEKAVVGSFTSAIRKHLSAYIKEGEPVENASCGECGGDMKFEGGCELCVDCGSGACS